MKFFDCAYELDSEAINVLEFIRDCPIFKSYVTLSQLVLSVYFYIFLRKTEDIYRSSMNTVFLSSNLLFVLHFL